MEQMNYEKEYKEALERAKTLYENANGLILKKWVEQVFPELKRNKDERIRKEIKDVFYSLGEGKIPVSINFADIFDWLEEQAKLVDEYEDRLDRCACESFNKGYKAAIEHQKEKQSETSTEDFGEFINILSKQFPEVSFAKLSRIAVRVKKWLEKQGEQKLLIEKLPEEMKTIGESLGFTTQEESDKYNQMVSDLIMSDGNKGEQKSAWSEEDERMMKSLTFLFDDISQNIKRDFRVISDAGRDNYENWLKSLKDRVQQKQEWSGEDIEMLNSAISFVEHSAFTTIGKGKNNVISWLKSLKERIGRV